MGNIVFNDAFLSFFRCGAGSNGGHYLIMEPVGNLVFKQGKMNAINSADYLPIKMGLFSSLRLELVYL